MSLEGYQLAVMHLVSARGGGSARFARDLVQAGSACRLLHVADDMAVVERPGAAVPFVPYRIAKGLAAAWLDSVLHAHRCEVLHVHYLQRATLELLEHWCPLGRPWVLSLHDLGFLTEHAFNQDLVEPVPDTDWMARWHRVMATAAAISVPSNYLADVFRRHFPDLPVQIVAPGVEVGEPDVPDGESPPDPARTLTTVAVVGALGPHKGKQRLLRWLQHANAARYRWVLIGYTDEQLHPACSAEGRLWVHGPFWHQQTAHWLHHYQVDLVVFPNVLAESFSYALSDVWSAGVPVLVPDSGALGERVRAHGGGSLLANPDRPEALLAALDGLRDGEQLALWRRHIAKNKHQMAPTTYAMQAAMNNIYADLPSAEMAPIEQLQALAQLQPFLRTQLDDVVFRHENIRLARDYGQVRDWAEKLEVDVARLEQDLVSLGSVRAELDQALLRRDADIAGLQARNQSVEADAAQLQQRNAEREARHAEQQARVAELHALVGHLSQQLDEQQAHTRLLAELSDAQAGEIASMHQRINALLTDVNAMRIKASRYDRVLARVPGWLKSLARFARSQIKTGSLHRRSA
jgi:hypothetical protein